jgi:hypothetical protein
MDKFKYPRTPHLPWSGSIANDDIVKEISPALLSQEVVVTEKMDGENFSMTRDYCHARSLDSKDHVSRNWVKGLYGNIRWNIPEDIKIVGENLFAEHSISYKNLLSYFQIFTMFRNDEVLSWKETCEIAESLGLNTVPVLYMGQCTQEDLFNIFNNAIERGAEGIVVRIANSFHRKDFQDCVAKAVRPNHVQTDDHWMFKPIVKNELAK